MLQRCQVHYNNTSLQDPAVHLAVMWHVALAQPQPAVKEDDMLHHCQVALHGPAWITQPTLVVGC
jgi:hypothetical protein